MAGINGKFKIGKVEDKGTWSQVRLSSASPKFRAEGEWEWSNWLASFVGEAHKSLAGMSEGDWIYLPEGKANVTNISYENKQGEMVWNNPKITVFEWEIPTKKEYKKSSDDVEFE